MPFGKLFLPLGIRQRKLHAFVLTSRAKRPLTIKPLSNMCDQVFRPTGKFICIRTIRYLISHSRFAGRHETATPPGVRCKQEVKHIGGVGTPGSEKVSIEHFSDKVLHPGHVRDEKKLHIITNNYYPNKMPQPRDMRHNATPFDQERKNN